MTDDEEDMRGTGERQQLGGSLAPLLRDRVLHLAVLWTGLSSAAILVLSGLTEWQVRTFWLGQIPLDALLAFASYRVSRVMTGPASRFWRVVACAGALFVCGDTVQTSQTFFGTGETSTTGGVVQSICLMIGLGSIIVAMLLHPHPSRSGRERLAFWLDATTVLVGGAVVAWCFAVTPDQSSAADVFPTLGAAAVAITAGFAAVKMVMSGNAPMHMIAAVSMIASAGFTSVGVFLAPEPGELPAYVYVLRFVPSMFIAVGPQIQYVIAGLNLEAFVERRRKPYSLLPYGSIGVAFGALIFVMRDGIDLQMWGVVVGLGLICSLVAGRQLVAFHDNETLIKELREQKKLLAQQALFDGLTELANRTHFHDEVAAALDRQEQASVLLIDLDGFKAVNDTMGHAAGDALLAAVADTLRATIRSADLAARLGGDEFAVLLRGCDSAEAELTAARIVEALAVPVYIFGVPVRASASIGVAGTVTDDQVNALLRRADTAMYVAKSEGKGTYRRFDPIAA